MLQLHDFDLSGNCYKIRLFLSLLDLPYERIEIDFLGGAHKTPEYLRINPLGQIPAIIDGDVRIRDSQAILVYLARRYGGEEWLPTDAEGLARTTQWLSNAANEIMHGFAVARWFHLMKRTQVDVGLATERAHNFLRMLNGRLQDRSWLEFDRPTIADIACFPYIALSHQGKIELHDYPHVQAWLARIKQLPRFIGMPGI